MNYLRSLSPFVTPDYLDPTDQLKIWQERILHALFLAGAVLGLIVSILFAFATSFEKDSTILFGCFGVFFLSLAFFALRRLSYWFRSITALTMVFVFANVIYFSTGWTGIALTLLLIFSFLSTTLLFQGPSRIGLFLSLTTLLLWGTLSIISGGGLASSINSLAIDLLIILLAGFCVNFTINSLKTRYLLIHQKNQSLEQEQKELLIQVQQQTDTLERRVRQLRTASEITRTISSILDPQTLIHQVTDAVKEQFDLYYVGVFLVDPLREFAVLQYGTGEAGRKMLANRHRLAVGGFSMIGWTTQTRKPRIALDIGEEAVHFDNPLLPDTRSELALPINTPNTLYGAMTIQSDRSGAFDQDDILVLQSIADSLAIAFENDNLFQRTQKTLEEIRVLNKAYVQQAWGEAREIYGDLHMTYENPDVQVTSLKTKTVKVPIFLRDEVIGEINVEVSGDEIQKEQLEFLESISSQTSVALENARLLDETQRAAAKEQKLNDLSTQFSRALTIEEILKTAVIEFGKLPLVSEASISLIPPEEMNLKIPSEKRAR